MWERFKMPVGTHLRRAHYWLVVSDEPVYLPDRRRYLNLEAHWHLLARAGAEARHLGLIAPDSFEDHRNPDPDLWAADVVDREEPWFMMDDVVHWSLPKIEAALEVLPFDLPEPEVFGYGYSGSDQAYHLEVWIEKSTQNDILSPLCRELHVNFVVGIGFQSITGTVNMLKRISRLPANKPVRVLYVSDFDPAGDWMPVAVARQAEFYISLYAPGRDLKLTPVVLTPDQVKKYRLPRKPIRESDQSKKCFEDRHGVGATELDALEALRPGVMAQIVRQAIKPYRDPTLEARLDEARDEAEKCIQAQWEEQMAGFREELEGLEEQAEEIAGRYRQSLADLDGQLQADLAPVHTRLEAVRHAVQQCVGDFRAELPDRPEPETEVVDEGDWLFDAGRDYLDQLAHYPSHKNRKRSAVCPGCGEEFAPHRKHQIYCKASCRNRAFYQAKKTPKAPAKKAKRKGKKASP
jgi:hypothetical protein